MRVFRYPDKGEWASILKRPELNQQDLRATVQEVFDAVKRGGDEALKSYTQKFDQVELETLTVSDAEFQAAEASVSEALKQAIQQAEQNIRFFHKSQQSNRTYLQTMAGVTCWRESRAIPAVGLYIPGGSAPLFSTVLMLGVPATIAGCQDIVLCTPPNREGKIDPAILYTCSLLGIRQVVKVGGIQAVAAMTCGTASVPAVDKIFGPGNQYVTAAKQEANRLGVAIDMPAGPSEVLVAADETCDAGFVAADLLSQAEHGPDSQVVLVTTDETLLDRVTQELTSQLKALGRASIAEQALQNSTCILVKERTDVLEMINAYAPEHLILAMRDPEYFCDGVQNAGSVFIGNYTPESAGDYASGTNHTLPTNGYARAYSGVSLDSFVKKITFQRISEEGIMNLGPTVEIMAEAEGLDAHKNAVSIRLKKLRNEN